jgi:enhancer of polycomb-like protein
MWKLERACGDANDVASAERAAEATEKGQIISYQDKCAMAASTKALPKAKAIELLEEVSGRPALLDAVYEYWANKRKARSISHWSPHDPVRVVNADP